MSLFSGQVDSHAHDWRRKIPFFFCFFVFFGFLLPFSFADRLDACVNITSALFVFVFQIHTNKDGEARSAIQKKQELLSISNGM